MTRYLEPTEAETYIQQYKLDTGPWYSATLSEQERALNIATRNIDKLAYKGVRADSSQENAFPRGNDIEVPQDIKDAATELAFALLDGVDPDIEFDSLTVENKRLGPVSTTSDVSIPRELIVAGIVSIEAWKLLIPYLRSQKEMRIERV